MKKLIMLIFVASLMFAITPVPRTQKSNTDKESKTKVEKIVKEQNKKQNENKDKKVIKKDHFKDSDSNGVNDQREDDFQKIKELKTKFKDLFKKKSVDTPKNKTVKKKKRS
jgi:hypothetical protein